MFENSNVAVIGDALQDTYDAFFKRYKLAVKCFPKNGTGIDLLDHQRACKYAIQQKYFGTFVFDETCIFSKEFFVMFRDFCDCVSQNKSGEIFHLGSENFGPTIGRARKKGVNIVCSTLNTTHHAYYIRGTGLRKLAEAGLSGGIADDIFMTIRFRKWSSVPSLVSKKEITGLAKLVTSPIFRFFLPSPVRTQSDVQRILEVEWQSLIYGVLMLVIFGTIRNYIEGNIASLI